ARARNSCRSNGVWNRFGCEDDVSVIYRHIPADRLESQEPCNRRVRHHLRSTVQLGTRVARPGGSIVSDPSVDPRTAWRTELPVLMGRRVTLREPRAQDVASLSMLFRAGEAGLFGVDEPLNDFSVLQYIERALAERVAGRGFTY